jgi:negative regulator of flagellin synthesis FlgM
LKIDNSTPVSRPLPTEQGKAAGKASGGTGASAPPATIAHISQAATDTSQDIDAARVDEIRRAISEGQLEIHTDKIADSLLASLKKMLEDDRR